jgi:hypothetical protein
MPIQHHLPSAIHDIFLDVLTRIAIRTDAHLTAALWTAFWGRHVDGSIPAGRTPTKPTGMPARRSPFFSLGVGGSEAGFLGSGSILAEALLALRLEFLLRLLQLLPQALILFRECRIAPPLVLQLPVKHVEVLILLVRGQNQRSQTGTANVRTMPHVRAAIFVLGIENEVHRPPFRCDDALPYAPENFLASPISACGQVRTRGRPDH